MKSRIAWAVVAAALACAPAARAAEGAFKPAPNATHLIDLDTRQGAYSSWSVTDLAGVDAVRATMTVKLLGDHPRWAPAYGLEVGDGEESVRVQILSVDRKTLKLFIVRLEGSQEWEQHPDAEIALDQPVEVAFDWTPDGKVAVVVHPQGRPALRREFRLRAAPTKVEASASTGELALTPLRLGSTR